MTVVVGSPSIVELSKTTIVIPVNGVLDHVQVSELQSAGNYVLPLSTTLKPNQILTVFISDLFKNGIKNIQMQGSDLVDDSENTDQTLIEIEDGVAGRIEIVTDGAGKWRV